jgi:hypothetical protein
MDSARWWMATLPSGVLTICVVALLLTLYFCLRFSKHLFVPNFAGVLCGYAEVTEANKHLIESCYESRYFNMLIRFIAGDMIPYMHDVRKANELPVLIQYFDKNKLSAPEATYLDIILYSREQIIAENAAMGEVIENPSDAPWGIISVKSQLCDYELVRSH